MTERVPSRVHLRPTALSDATVTIHIPFRRRQYGGRKTIITLDGSPSPAARPLSAHLTPAVKALARAFRWRKLMETGVHQTLKDLAAVERVNPSYVSRVLRLTLLAPDLIEVLLDGRHSAGLKFDRFMKQFPIEWNTQRKSLNFIASLDEAPK